MRIVTPRSLPTRPFLLAAALLLLPCAARAVPPVPGKQGYQGPREGLSTARLRPDFAALSLQGERIAIQAQVTWRTLAIRVAFSDTPVDSSDAYYNRVLFFLNQFWNQNTDGVVTVQADLWPTVYTLPHPMAYYGDDARFQERLVYLVRDMVALADPDVDFRPYRSFIIFHAGQGQEADVRDDSRDEVWSAFVTPTDFETILPDPSGAVGIPTNDLVGGVPFRIKEAVVLPESESQDGNEFGMVGVTVHEYGHQLGLPDLYDTTPDRNGYNQGLGSWDIMAQGVWNANGYVPAGPSAWCRLRLGALAPQRVTSDATLTLAHLTRPVGFNPRAALIPITQSEYFLIENRDQDSNWNGKFDFDDANANGNFDFYTDSYAGAEFDYFLPGTGTGSGVIIYHVDEAKIDATLTDNVVEGDTDRKGVDVVEADGIQDLDEPPNAFNGGSPDDLYRRFWRDRFTPATTPSTEAYGHVPTGISVTEIGPPDASLAADSLMTLHVSFERNRPGWPLTLVNRRVGGTPPLAADLDGDGIQELIVPARQLSNPGEVYVFEPDGTDFLKPDPNPATPTPFAVPTVEGSTGSPIPTSIVSTPCVGDIDGDGGNELVFSTLNGAIFAFHANGTEVRDGDANPLTLGVLVPGCTPGVGGCSVRTQPILVDLDGDGAKEIVYGRNASVDGGSRLTAARLAPTGVEIRSLPMGGSTAGAPAAADLDGDGFPEVIVANRPTGSELSATGLSIANWEIFTDPVEFDYPAYLVAQVGASPSAPVISDLDRAGGPEVILADSTGAIHAFSFTFLTHIPGDPPARYVMSAELPGWPVQGAPARGAVPEVSLGDLEGDGHPEVFHMGADARVTAVHYSGSARSGYPFETAQPLAVQDTTGVWPPLIADVDGDGRLDVIPVVPDGRRPAVRADGSLIPSFVELGSTAGPPPLLVDLDGDGRAEWVEAFDSGDALITVRSTAVPVAAAAVAWPQYRLGPARDGFFPSSPGSTAGTPILSEVYGYPNPAHGGATTIHYRLGEAARAVRVRILDPAGNSLAELPTGPADLAGGSEHGVVWNHAGLASGVYLGRVEVETGRGTEVRFTKLAILR